MWQQNFTQHFLFWEAFCFEKDFRKQTVGIYMLCELLCRTWICIQLFRSLLIYSSQTRETLVFEAASAQLWGISVCDHMLIQEKRTCFCKHHITIYLKHTHDSVFELNSHFMEMMHGSLRLRNMSQLSDPHLQSIPLITILFCHAKTAVWLYTGYSLLSDPIGSTICTPRWHCTCILITFPFSSQSLKPVFWQLC